MFKFSVKNYYFSISILLLYPIGWAFFSHSPLPLILFFIFAFMGVLGEVLFSFWWQIFYEKRFWAYRAETFEHSYSSWLNFIPWGLGGTLYLNSILLFHFDKAQLYTKFFGFPIWMAGSICFIAGVTAQILFWRTKKHHLKFRDVNAANYLFFISPFLFALAVSLFFFGSWLLPVAICFALVAAMAEYAFGKVAELIISKKLWSYNYWAADNGHFTPLALLPFSLAGFYFWSIALIVQMFR